MARVRGIVVHRCAWRHNLRLLFVPAVGGLAVWTSLEGVMGVVAGFLDSHNGVGREIQDVRAHYA
jgi:hypothetical protein